MKRILAAVFSLTMLAAPLLAIAKGNLVRIEVAGPTLSATRVVTDAQVLRGIFIWSGPGTGQRLGASIGTDSGLIDWQAGIVKRVPANMTSYEVSFFCVTDRAKPEGRLTYAVKYAYDLTTRRGYIYLPGPTEKNYDRNTSTIFHDAEGNWFNASERWEALVAPLFRDGGRLATKK
jgi:hypothetical protein